MEKESFRQLIYLILGALVIVFQISRKANKMKNQTAQKPSVDAEPDFSELSPQKMSPKSSGLDKKIQPNENKNQIHSSLKKGTTLVYKAAYQPSQIVNPLSNTIGQNIPESSDNVPIHLDQTELKKAIIYSEILNPKYF
jgi:hypothetical protein